MSIKHVMNIVRMLENTASTNEKADLIKSAAVTSSAFKDMLGWALNPYLLFNTQKVTFPVMEIQNKKTDDWAFLAAALNKIVTDKLRGSALQSHINITADYLDATGKELFKRVLLKDLRCGTGATLVNRVLPGHVPEFGVMLATPLEERHIRQLQQEDLLWIQPKLNGDRMVAIIPPSRERKLNPSRALSRKGHELLNYNAILRSLEFVVDQSAYNQTGLTFDGEVIVGDFFKTRQTKKLSGNETEGAVFHAFDMVDYPMWKSNTSHKFELRYQKLRALSNTSAWTHFENVSRVLSFRVAKDQKLSMAYFDGIRNTMIKSGFEGLMVRLNDLYNYKTRSSIFKHKKMDNMDCLILEIREGDEGKKHEGRAGRILVEQTDGTPCLAGLKMTDPERVKMWNDRHDLVGKVAEIQYQEMTTPKKGPPKMQFPVFVKVREDKS